jgi:hypothetical protein
MPTFFNENTSPSVTQETDAALVSLGQRSCAVSYEAGAIPQGNYAAIQCLTDCTFDALDTVYGTATASPFWDLVDNLFIVPAGTIFYGAFTVITVASGTCIAYKA